LNGAFEWCLTPGQSKSKNFLTALQKRLFF